MTGVFAELQQNIVFLMTLLVIFGIVLLVAVYFPQKQIVEYEPRPLNSSIIVEVFQSFCSNKMSGEPSLMAGGLLNDSFIACHITKDGWIKTQIFTRHEFDSWVASKEPLAAGGTVI